MERKKRMNIITLDVSHMHGQLKNHIFPNKGKLRPRYYAKSPPAQDVFQTIPGLISYTRVTGGCGLLSHAQNTVRWLALSIQQVESL